MAKFRREKAITEWNEYLVLSASNSASVSYDRGKYILETQQYDGMTGERVGTHKQYLTERMVQNKISGSVLRETTASSSRQGLDQLFKDMKKSKIQSL